MRQPFDDLAEDLSNGLSRRKALQRFALGLGAAFAAVFSSRSAEAQGNSVCVDWCKGLGLRGKDLGKCVSASAKCPNGECALMSCGGEFCVPSKTWAPADVELVWVLPSSKT